MGNRAKTGIKEHVGAPTRRNMIPPKYVGSVTATVIMDCIEKGCAIVCIGSANSPIDDIMKGIHRSMWMPCNNGVAMYDNYIPFRKQNQREVVAEYINDWGSETYIDSVRVLKAKKAKTLYKYVYKTKKGEQVDPSKVIIE